MARFYAINFNSSLYLTSNGTNTGVPCKLDVPNLEDLLTDVVGRSEPSADGTPVSQTFPFVKGKNFEIKINTLTQAVWNSVKTLLSNSLANQITIVTTGTGDIGNFSVNCRPNPSKPYSAESFRNGKIKNVTLRFITI